MLLKYKRRGFFVASCSRVVAAGTSLNSLAFSQASNVPECDTIVCISTLLEHCTILTTLRLCVSTLFTHITVNDSFGTQQ